MSLNDFYLLRFDEAFFFFCIFTKDFADKLELPSSKKSSSSSFQPNEEAVMMIVGMGFTKDQAIKALKATVSYFDLFLCKLDDMDIDNSYYRGRASRKCRIISS